MNNFYISALITIVKFLVKNVNWQLIMDTVVQLSQSDLSGDEKRKVALDKLKELVQQIGKPLVSLAIEAVVLKLRAE